VRKIDDEQITSIYINIMQSYKKLIIRKNFFVTLRICASNLNIRKLYDSNIKILKLIKPFLCNV